jgi:hypothetical protein
LGKKGNQMIDLSQFACSTEDFLDWITEAREDPRFEPFISEGFVAAVQLLAGQIEKEVFENDSN